MLLSLSSATTTEAMMSVSTMATMFCWCSYSARSAIARMCPTVPMRGFCCSGYAILGYTDEKPKHFDAGKDSQKILTVHA